MQKHERPIHRERASAVFAVFTFKAPAAFVAQLWDRCDRQNKTMTQIVVGALARDSISVPESLVMAIRRRASLWGCDGARAKDQFTIAVPQTLGVLLRSKASEMGMPIRARVLKALQRDGFKLPNTEVDRRHRMRRRRLEEPNGRLVAQRLRLVELDLDQRAGACVQEAATNEGMTVQRLFAEALCLARLCSDSDWAKLAPGFCVRVVSGRYKRVGSRPGVGGIRVGIIMPQIVWSAVVAAARMRGLKEQDILAAALTDRGVGGVESMSSAKMRVFDVVWQDGEYRPVSARGRRVLGKAGT